VTQAAEVILERANARAKPRLVIFHSSQSGRCRRVEGFIAQVLQRRRNHATFVLHRVDVDEQPELAERFRVEAIPALFVVEGKRARARLDEPQGCGDIEEFLTPWLN
jgi:thioredoxin 1